MRNRSVRKIVSFLNRAFAMVLPWPPDIERILLGSRTEHAIEALKHWFSGNLSRQNVTQCMQEYDVTPSSKLFKLPNPTHSA